MKRILLLSIFTSLQFCWGQGKQEPEPPGEVMRAPAVVGKINDLKARLENPETKKSEHPQIEAEIASVYLAAGDFINASRHLERSVNLQEKPPVQQYYALGRLYIQNGDDDKALELLLKAEESFPDSPDIADLITSCYQAKQNWAEAIKRCEKIVKLSESNRPLPATFYFKYGVMVERGEGDVDRAAQLFKQALERIEDPNPRNLVAVEQTRLFKAEVLNYLGYMQVEKGVNLDVAGELIKKAAELNPESGAIADSLGWYYFKKERYMEAMAELLRAESWYAEEDLDGVILDHIAQTYKKIGNTENAIKYMQRALEKEPKNKAYRRRLRKFRASASE